MAERVRLGQGRGDRTLATAADVNHEEWALGERLQVRRPPS